MENTRISFLIPSYNHGKYVCHTLDSIRADAEGLDYEILLIDDGSKDDSRTLIDAWHAANPEAPLHVTYRENRGVSATLNQLVSMASGGIVRLCASDDAVVAGSSARMLAAFGESDAQVLAGDAWVMGDDNQIVGESAIRANGGEPSKMTTEAGLKMEIVANWSIPGPCFAIRREVYGIVGNYAEDLPIEDWDFFLRVVAQCRMRFIGGQVSYYRIHGTNASRTADVARRIRNLRAQLAAGRRRAPLLQGKLRVALDRECAILELKVAYLSRSLPLMGAAGWNFVRGMFA